MVPDTDALKDAGERLCVTARWCYTRGWVPATSVNFSVRQDGRILITASGLDKGTLTPGGLMEIDNETEVHETLSNLGIDYERWDLSRVGPDAPAEAVLVAYAGQIDAMKQRGGYQTADVIDVNPETPGLDSMLARFDKEHTHSEDEVRFILAGRGIFFLHLAGKVVSVEVHPGDMLRVPRGTTHWFTLCADKRIRAIRWFQDTTGWTPHYTGSGVDQAHQPLCFGPAYFGPRVTTTLST